MDPYAADRAKKSIQEYTQRNPEMGGSRGSQVNQYGRGQKSSAITLSTFAEHIAQLPKSWNEEGFSSLDQALLMCEMIYPYTSRSAQVACAAAIKTKK